MGELADRNVVTDDKCVVGGGDFVASDDIDSCGGGSLLFHNPSNGIMSIDIDDSQGLPVLLHQSDIGRYSIAVLDSHFVAIHKTGAGISDVFDLVSRKVLIDD